MSLSARPPSAKRAGSAAPRQGTRGSSKAGLPPSASGRRRSPDANGKPGAITARAAQNEVMAAVVAATGSSIFNGPPDNLFGTSDFYHKRQQKKADVFKKTGKGAPSQPVLGITVESLISEMRAQHDRIAKLKAASAAAVDGVKSRSIRFSSVGAAAVESSVPSPRRSVARPPMVLTSNKDGDFGAMADAAAATLNSSTMHMPKMPPSPSSASRSPDASSAALAAVFHPTPPKHAAGPFLPPPRTQPSVPSSGGKRRGSTAASRRASVMSSGAGSRSGTPTHHGGRGSPDHPHKRLHFGKSTSASVGRGIMDAAKAKYQQLIEATRQVSAAIILQRWFRANRTTWQLRRQHKTEKRIAITFSRCIMKLIVKVRMNRKRREAAKAEAAARRSREFAAAATIQRLVRGVLARAAAVRMHLALARHRRWRGRIERRQYAAARIVTWWFRVKHARRGRRLQAIATRRDFNFVTHQLKWHKHIRESRNFADGIVNRHEAAARTIQAAYRGHRVRLQRGMFFFLRKYDLPPVVAWSGPKSARTVTALSFREWMTSPKYGSF